MLEYFNNLRKALSRSFMLEALFFYTPKVTSFSKYYQKSIHDKKNNLETIDRDSTVRINAGIVPRDSTPEGMRVHFIDN